MTESHADNGGDSFGTTARSPRRQPRFTFRLAYFVILPILCIFGYAWFAPMLSHNPRPHIPKTLGGLHKYVPTDPAERADLERLRATLQSNSGPKMEFYGTADEHVMLTITPINYEIPDGVVGLGNTTCETRSMGVHDVEVTTCLRVSKEIAVQVGGPGYSQEELTRMVEEVWRHK